MASTDGTPSLVPPSAARPTIKDVARAAAVSPTTVSNVMTGARHVGPELADRVRAAMASLGYRPNGTARSLRLRRTHTLGLVVPDITAFFAEVARAIEDAGFEAGYTTVLASAHNRPERERDYVETLLARQVDGLILGTTHVRAADVEALLADVSVPVVLLDRDLGVDGVDLVLADNVQGAQAVTAHLVSLGHRRVACIAGDPAMPNGQERVEGYRRALVEAGVEPRDAWVEHGDFSVEGAQRALDRLLDRDPTITAVFAANDVMAIAAAHAVARRGLSVPDDVSVAGFDDSYLAELVSPRLTTARQPVDRLGRATVDLLRRRLADPTAAPGRTVLPTEVVVRGSTAPPRAAVST